MNNDIIQILVLNPRLSLEEARMLYYENYCNLEISLKKLEKKKLFAYNGNTIDLITVEKGKNVEALKLIVPKKGKFLVEWSLLSQTVSPHLWFYYNLHYGKEKLNSWQVLSYQHYGCWIPLKGSLVCDLLESEEVILTLYHESTYPNAKAKQFTLKLKQIY